MQDLVFLTENMGLARESAVLYSDQRAVAEAALLSATFSKERLAAETTNVKGAASCLAKWKWIANKEPATLQATSRMVLGAPGFIVARLTAECMCDATTASTTGLLAPGGDRYCAELLSDFGLNAALLPRLTLPQAVVGAALPGAAFPQALAGVPVFHVGGDLAAAAHGAGAASHLYLGTSGWIAMLRPAPAPGAPPPPPGVFRVAAPEPGAVIEAASMITAGGAVEWGRAAFLAGASPSAFDTAAATAPLGSRGVQFLPHLCGERSPFEDPRARGAMLGLSPAADSACLARAVLEGVAFGYKALSAALGPASPARSGAPLPVLGGGSRSALWMAMMADMLRTPIAARGSGSHAVARGAAAWAWAGLGAPPEPAFFRGGGDDGGRGDEPGEQAVYWPDEVRAAKYDELFELWRRVHPTLAAAGLQGGGGGFVL